MSDPLITCAPCPDTTSEAELAELNALASAYKFVLDCRAKKEAAPESRPENPERSSDEIRAKTRIP